MNTTQDGNPPSHILTTQDPQQANPMRYTKKLHLQHIEAFWNGNLEQWTPGLHSDWSPARKAPESHSWPEHYRITHSKQLRPWNTTEIPLGAQIRAKGFHDTFLIVGVLKGLIIWNDGCARTSSPAILFKDFEHSTDQGKTWLHCGVEE